MMFKALMLENSPAFSASVQSVYDSRLPAGDVTVLVACSMLDCKEGLAITNKLPVERQWPMVAAVDGAGTVLESSHPDWNPGDGFVHDGWGVGGTRWGCRAERARLKGDCLVRLPAAFAARQAMAIGTAGHIAMLLLAGAGTSRHHARGGRGAVHWCHRRRRKQGGRPALLPAPPVVAATGKASEEAYLRQLGASAIIDRAGLAKPGKSMHKERWATVVDAVGSHSLANALAQTRYGSVVAACGLAQGQDLPTTVHPFFLRGVSLLGVDLVMAPHTIRQRASDRLATDLDLAKLEIMVEEITLDDAIAKAQALMDGKVRGSVVVRIDTTAPDLAPHP
jgi:acrylyl-CoA reductase (NADPH)